jgi:HK97 gp10 family phage protein
MVGKSMKQVAKLDTSGLDRLTAQLEARAEKIIASAALQIEGEAKVRAPVDTGALRSSIMAEAKKRLLWWVHDGVEYGQFIEMGTSRMKAQPFLIPAVEKVRAKFNEKWAELFKP